jgi:hypothetical protein
MVAYKKTKDRTVNIKAMHTEQNKKEGLQSRNLLFYTQ